MHISFEILPINISTVRLSATLLDDYFVTQKIHCLHRAQVSMIEHEQKDKTKILVKFPDHVFIDYDYV